MRRMRPGRALAVATTLGLVLAACGGDDDDAASDTTAKKTTTTEKPATTTTEEPTTTTEEPATTTEEPATTTTEPAAPGEVQQWASSAEATTQYGDDSWSAAQATGEPDAAECADDAKAWASLASDTVDVLTVHFAEAVVPSMVSVVQSYNPGQVTEIAVSGPGGESAVVYEADPSAMPDASCPSSLDVGIGALATFPVDTVAITVDQSVLGVGWGEIDAVQLVGAAA